MPNDKVCTLVVMVASLLVAVASPASGYVRTKTCDSYGTYKCGPNETPKPISWPVRCVKYRINLEGSSQFQSDPEGHIGRRLRNEVVEAFDTWNQPRCSDFQLVEGPLTTKSQSRYVESKGYVGNTNLVVWRDEEWPYGGAEGDVFALTKVRFSSSGVVQDADIEVNTARFEFDILRESKEGERGVPVDLRNSLTHEVGHLLGLAHPSVEKATMYGKASPGEINKRTLEPDDIEGLCAIYPAQQPRATCEEPADFVPDRGNGGNGRRPGPCGCATTGGVPGGSGLLFVVGFCAWLGRRRRAGD